MIWKVLSYAAAYGVCIYAAGVLTIERGVKSLKRGSNVRDDNDGETDS